MSLVSEAASVVGAFNFVTSNNVTCKTLNANTINIDSVVVNEIPTDVLDTQDLTANVATVTNCTSTDFSTSGLNVSGTLTASNLVGNNNTLNTKDLVGNNTHGTVVTTEQVTATTEVTAMQTLSTDALTTTTVNATSLTSANLNAKTMVTNLLTLEDAKDETKESTLSQSGNTLNMVTNTFTINGNLTVTGSYPGGGGSGLSNLQSLANRLTWNAGYALNSDYRCVTWSPELKLLCAVNGTLGTDKITTSPDGLVWTPRVNSTFAVYTAQGNKIIWDNVYQRFFTVGSGTNSYAFSNNSLGLTWTASSNLFSTSAAAVVSNKKSLRYVAGGNSGNKLAYSDNGTTWSSAANEVFSVQCLAAEWFAWKNLWLAGGEGTANTLATSSDGVTWTGLGNTLFTTRCNGLAFNPTKSVAVGEGTNTLAFSLDGTTWVGLGDSIFSVSGNAVAWGGVGTLGGNLWIAGGEGANHSLAYSVDGIYWYGIGKTMFSKATGVVYGGLMASSRWVAVGEGNNTLATSDNGISWSGLAKSIFSVAGRGVAWNGLQFVAVGEGTYTIAFSVDGVFWTGLGAEFVGSLTGTTLTVSSLIVNPTTFKSTPITMGMILSGTGITAGTRITAFQSGTGGLGTYTVSVSYPSTVSPPSITATAGFTTAGNSVTWAGTYWVATGEGTNSLAYSTDGITWTGLGTTTFDKGLVIAAKTPEVLVGGVSGGVGVLCYSPDSNNWTSFNFLFPTVFTTTANCVVGKPSTSNTPLWVVGGSGTNTLGVSRDGMSWSGLNALTFTTVCNGVAFNGTNTWVAVGEGGDTLAYSNSGLNWIRQGGTVFGTRGNGVAYGGLDGNPRWIAVGFGTNTVAYSTDGVNWTVLGTSVLSGQGLGVAYGGTTGNSRWIVVGNSIAFSPTGLSGTWTAVASSPFSTTGRGIAFGNNLWVAVGDGAVNTIASSSDDGVTWTGAGKTIFTTQGNGVVYGNGTWVAVGQGTNSIAYSTDGTTWTGLGLTVLTIGTNVTWNGQLFVAVGTGVVAANNIVYSYNGINWFSSSFPSSTSINDIAYNPDNNSWLAGCTGTNSLMSSPNGVNWLPQGATALGSPVTSVAWGGPIGGVKYWVTTGTTAASTIAYSANGFTWTAPTNRFSSAGRYVTWTGTRFVATGAGGTTPIFSSSSTDITSWTGTGITVINAGQGITAAAGRLVISGSGSNNVFSAQGNGVVYGGAGVNRWVAVGSGVNTLAYSSDGIVWTGLTTTVFNSSGRGVAFNESVGTPRFVAVGSGLNSIAYSSDGVTWTGLSTSIFSTAGYGVAYGDMNKWVAVGEGTNSIAYSTDNGLTWTGLGLVYLTKGFGVAYNGTNRWVAVGTGSSSIFYSSDAINWTPVFDANSICTQFNAVEYGGPAGNKLFVAGGSTGSNVFAYSVDGITWTAAGSGFMTAVFVRWVGSTINKWFAGGLGGLNTLAYSTDGKTWIGASNNACATAVRGLAYNGTNRFVAVGQGDILGPSTIVYSSDGFNWVSVGNNAIVYSTDDGVSWTGVQCSGSMFSTANFSAYNGTKWMTVGAAGSSALFAHSNDGIRWGNFDQVIGGVMWSKKRALFLAYILTGGSRSTQQLVATSSNGINWILRDTGYNSTANFGVSTNNSTNAVGSVCWSEEKEKFIGWASAYTNMYVSNSWLYTSTDGIDWTTTPPVLVNYAGGPVIWVKDLNKYVTVGSVNNTVLTSTDGISWNAIVVPGINKLVQVVWSPFLQKLCALASNSVSGRNTVMVSSDGGATWTLGDMSTGDMLCLEWSEELKIFCVLALNTAIISQDGINWYTINTLLTANTFRSLVWVKELQAFCGCGRRGAGNFSFVVSKLIP